MIMTLKRIYRDVKDAYRIGKAAYDGKKITSDEDHAYTIESWM